MTLKQIALGLLTIAFISCNSKTKTAESKQETYADIQIAGAMKNVMWKGELEGVIQLDTIKNKTGLFGLGPVSYLTGEILVNDGQVYVSKVLTDSTMLVEKTPNVAAPFFVYGIVNEWNETDLPKNIKTIKDLETYLNEKTSKAKRPFTLKLSGQVSNAQIHIQNLPKGTKVSSPDEAHQGQTNYNLQNKEVEIVGFFSTEHKGVFTHHDSFLHLHLITKDEKQMGHLDAVEFNTMKLYLPKK